MQLLEMPAMTVREFAAYAGVRRETVYAWIREKKIDVTLDVCNQYRIPYGEAHRILKEREG